MSRRYVKAPPRRRPKRVAKKIARRCGALHHDGAEAAWLDHVEREVLHLLQNFRGPMRTFGQVIHAALDGFSLDRALTVHDDIPVTFLEPGSEHAQAIKAMLRAFDETSGDRLSSNPATPIV